MDTGPAKYPLNISLLGGFLYGIILSYHDLMNTYFLKISFLFLIVVFLLGFFLRVFPHTSRALSSSMFGPLFSVALTPDDLMSHYREKKLKILLVSGHDNESSGSRYRGAKESDLNLAISRNLFEILSADEHFEVITTRNFSGGEYADEFLAYFTRQGPKVRSFRDTLKTKMRELIIAGAVKERDSIKQVGAGNDVSYKLYAINKWANENFVDVVLHLHFNDYPGRPRELPGKYSGFALYVPEQQYPNAKASRALAESLFSHLKNHFPVSNFPLETSGIIEDQDLIATGSNASRIGASLLVEYGYIYESQITNKDLKDAVILEFAYQTYLGLKKHFEDSLAELSLTTYFPHTWNTPLEQGDKGKNVLALQQALAQEKLYPPSGKTLADCPINGNFGPCVEKAVTLFQEKYMNEILAPIGLSKGTGVMGEKTREKLNAIYGG